MVDVAASAHPLAALIPEIGDDEYTSLRDSIREQGQLERIVLYQGVILDGRARYRACLDLGLDPLYRDFEGRDAAAFVLAANLHRRHLTVEQRALVAARLPRIAHGSNRFQQTAVDTSGDASTGMSRETRAAMAGVSIKTVERAERLVDGGIDALVDRVERGLLPIADGARAAKLSPALQQEVARADTDRASTVVKQVLRANREREMAEASDTAAAQLATARRYNVILADPPWRFEVWSQRGMDRAADNHYPTTTIDSLSIMDVPAADDCVLFLWATAPMLREALTIMEAWDFEYRTHFVWDKDRAGTGYWNRNKHELLLIGTRGDIPAPAPGTQWNSVVAARWPGEHSAKPIEFHQLVEAYYPTARKLEMFARDRIRPPRDGWDTWGNEAAGLSDTAEVPDNAAVS